jgi:hypothetical protein
MGRITNNGTTAISCQHDLIESEPNFQKGSFQVYHEKRFQQPGSTYSRISSVTKMWIKLSPAEAEYPKWQHQPVLVALPSPLKAADINSIRHIATQAFPLQKTFQYMCRHGTTTECMNQSKAVTILEHKSWRRQRKGSTKDYSFVHCSNINLERGRKFSPLTSTEGQNESEFLYSSMEH